MSAIDSIESHKGTKIKDIDMAKDTREGIERLQSAEELVKIWECYCWHDINDDGELEKCVVTIAPDFSLKLREITLPFYSGKFPFVKLFYELTDDRWFSHRGMGELLEDIIKEIDIQHMQKIDYGTFTNTPLFLHRAGMVNKNTMQFTFGQSLPVHGMQSLDDIMKPLQMHNPNIDFSYERTQMILETKVEELIGQVDYSLQSMINKREPRTLGEVQLQQQNMQMVFSLDADMFREQHADLFNWVWDLWSQYGDDEYEFMYFGKDAPKDGEKIRLTKEETQGKYKITVRGNDQNTNPQVRMQKAQSIMQAQANETAVGMGVVNPMTMYNAYKRFYQELEIPNWEELVAQPQPQQPPPPPVKIDMEDLTDMEKAAVLQKYGIKPDPQGRFLNEKNRRQDINVEQLIETVKAIKQPKPKPNANGTKSK